MRNRLTTTNFIHRVLFCQCYEALRASVMFTATAADWGVQPKRRWWRRSPSTPTVTQLEERLAELVAAALAALKEFDELVDRFQLLSGFPGQDELVTLLENGEF